MLVKRGSGLLAETTLKFEDLEMNLLSRRVTRNDKAIDLQPREFKLLEYLLRNAGQVVTRTMLLENVWEYHFDPQTNVIDVHISRLRSKIDKDFDPPLVHTIRGAGVLLTCSRLIFLKQQLFAQPYCICRYFYFRHPRCTLISSGTRSVSSLVKRMRR